MGMGALMGISPASRAQNELIAAAFGQQRDRIWTFVRRQLGDAPETEEIVQDVFYELVQAYRLMQPIEHLAAWLMTVARNRVIDRFRARAKERREEDPESILESLQVPEASGPEADYSRAALADAFEAALAELPAEQRQAFIAHELQGQSVREIAAAQRVPVNTVLWRKRAAVLHLRSRLRALYEEMHG
jgi:RNA polymerase sigma factor (sigma-70 family)